MPVLLLCTNWLRLWALLQKAQHKGLMESGAKRPKWITKELHAGLGGVLA